MGHRPDRAALHGLGAAGLPGGPLAGEQDRPATPRGDDAGLADPRGSWPQPSRSGGSVDADDRPGPQAQPAAACHMCDSARRITITVCADPSQPDLGNAMLILASGGQCCLSAFRWRLTVGAVSAVKSDHATAMYFHHARITVWALTSSDPEKRLIKSTGWNTPSSLRRHCPKWESGKAGPLKFQPTDFLARCPDFDNNPRARSLAQLGVQYAVPHRAAADQMRALRGSPAQA